MMRNFKHAVAWLLLALSLAAPACATVYHVDIDTAPLGSGSAFLGLSFLGLGCAAPATATVTGLTGAFTGVADTTGAVTGGAPGPLVFADTDGGGDWVQAVTLGGKFSFDVSFAYAAGNDGATFGWALFDAVQYLGADGDLGNLSVQPGAPANAQIVLAQAGALSEVTVIPEPSSLALVMLACVAMGAARRRGA
jgi:hypothetical protein